MSHEGLHVLPRDELVVLILVAPEAAGQQAPQPDAEARVDSRHPPGAVAADQIDLACLHEPRLIHIDQAPVKDVSAQQHLARAPLELGQVELRRRRTDGLRAQLCQIRDRHKTLAPADARFQAHHGRQALPVETYYDVFDAAQPLSGRVEQGGAR